MGKIKRPSAERRSRASDVFGAPRYYIFKRSLPSPRQESLSIPQLSLPLFLSFSLNIYMLCFFPLRLSTREDGCAQGFARTSKEKRPTCTQRKVTPGTLWVYRA